MEEHLTKIERFGSLAIIILSVIALLLMACAAMALDVQTTAGDDRLWAAICQVESGGKANVTGDGGRAVGVAQIWAITVADCNRILRHAEFTLADRLSPARSKEMFFVYTRHYCQSAGGWTQERAARIWNAGPLGYKKAATLKYWQKVSKELANG